MIRWTVTEYGRIPRKELGDKLLIRLQRFDEQYARSTGEQVFDWSRVAYVRALNQVGVIQVPGLTVEILPKTDDTSRDEPLSQDQRQRAQRNLLYMLAVSRNLPIRPRDLAGQRIQRLPMLETLITLFVTRLLRELRRGVEHAYVYLEENRVFLRGKLLLSEHIKRNVARSDRVFVGYDDFTPDIWLNRILKAENF